MRIVVTMIALFLLAFPAAAADGAAQSAMTSLLAGHKRWVIQSEYTDALQPSDRAQKLNFEFYERDGRLKGRWIVEFGGCEFDVALRADGFSFPWCPPYGGEPSLDYDAADARYPFKSRSNPRKLWMTAAP